MSGVFLVAGVALLVGAPPEAGTAHEIFINLGCGFLTSVVLLLAFALVEPRYRRTAGIDYRALEVHLSRARREIRILTTFTYLFCVPQNTESGLDVERIGRCFEQLKRRVRNNPHLAVRILLLDPTSDAAAQRARDRQDIDLIGRVWENIITIRDWLAPLREHRVEVRVYRALPRLSLVQWDDVLSISFFDRDRSISRSDRTELPVHQPVGRFIEASFDQLWNDPLTQPLEGYCTSCNCPRTVEEAVASGLIRRTPPYPIEDRAAARITAPARESTAAANGNAANEAADVAEARAQ